MRSRLIGVLLLAALGPVEVVAQGEPPRVMVLRDVIDTSNEQELRWPVAVATADNRVAVADAFGARLLLFERAGVSWSLTHEVVLSGPPVGVVRVGERWLATIRGSGAIDSVDDTGRVNGSVSLPRGLVAGPLAAYRTGDLLVYDAAGSSVVRLEENGRIIRSVPVDGYVTALAVEGDGGFLAAVGDKGSVLRFGPSGELESTWRVPEEMPLRAWPSGLAIEPGGRVFVADRTGNRIVALDRQGRWVGLGSRKGWDPGLLRRPSGMAWSSAGELVVADLENGRVQVFKLTSSGAGS